MSHAKQFCCLSFPTDALKCLASHGNHWGNFATNYFRWKQDYAHSAWLARSERVVSLGFFHFLIHPLEARVDTNPVCNLLLRCWRSSLIFKWPIDKELSLHLKLWLKWRKVFQKICGHFLSKVLSLCKDLIFSLTSAMKFEKPLYAACKGRSYWWQPNL